VKTGPSWKKELGKELREARRRLGVSVAELAEKSGVSRQMIYRYEDGSRSPGVDVLALACRVLGKISFVIDGNRVEIRAEDFTLKPRAVPKQLRMEVGFVCGPEHASIRALKSSRDRNRVVINAVLSA
jgi:transcriptional regulator with XRE-family HTH domain